MAISATLAVKILYICSGCVHYLSPQWAENTNATGSHMKIHEFKHPFFMACLKYLGQLFCILLYYIAFGRQTVPNNNTVPGNVGPGAIADGGAVAAAADRPEPRPFARRRPGLNPRFPPEERDPTKYNKFIFLLCTLCDMARTGLLYVGPKLTYPSSSIMLSGTVTFFTALLSVAFLATPLQNRMWFGVCVSVCGLAVLGLRDYVFVHLNSYDSYGIAAGDLLIVMAMIMTATQVILEEKFVKKHNISPLLTVGIEGLFGFVLTLILVVVFYFVHAGGFSKLPEHRLEDFIDAFTQMKSSWRIALAVVGTVVSVCFYSYFGITIAKSHDHGAVSRMVLDNIATLFVFAFFLIVGWQPVHWVMSIGFCLVVLGVMFYYDFIFYNIYLKIRRGLGCPELVLPGADTEPLLVRNDAAVQER
ncbi:solute carrier family 35 member F6-like [Gigantopelta aegis]|uniref:solute carrier family 35 member F6-like n=1 Tax=Gigantopelta aegis TaxID=1735272 RepID=UPI001B88DE78|nr:solute carrier family 35 member F6-like [Gigantopelta aegis]